MKPSRWIRVRERHIADLDSNVSLGVEGGTALAPHHVSLSLLLAMLSAGAGAGDLQMRQEPACLSLSPLRALPAARLDSARGAWWRDRLADSLRKRLEDSKWVLASAGQCPDGLPVLDVFQQPGDLTRDADGSLVKLRFEWRHRPGTTLAILDDPDHPESRIGLWASQVKVAADLQLGTVAIASPLPAKVSILAPNTSWRPLGETPQEWSQAPGRITLRLSREGLTRDIDTLLESGQRLRLDAPAFPTPGPKPARSRWSAPLWGASALCLAGGLWYSLEMERAYSRYSRLDESNSPQDFSDQWSEVRSANLLRNILLAGSGVFLAGALYLHF